MKDKFSYNWIVGLNNMCRMILMPTLLILLFLYNTIVNTWIGGKIATLQNMLAIIIIVIFLCNFLDNPKEKILKWIKDNKLAIMYIIVRIISLCLNGFNYSVIRSIFFEVFLIVCISNKLVLQDRKIYAKVFVFLQLFFCFLSIVLYFFVKYLEGPYAELISKYTNYGELGNNALLFGNPNSAGIMAGFGLIIAIIFFKQNLCNKRVAGLYVILNLIALIFFGCRSAEIGIIVVGFVIFCFSILRNRAVIKKIIYISLICTAGSTIFIYGVMMLEGGINNLELSPLESKINTLSTGRYLIWNECAVEQQDSFFFGEGSLKTEQEERKRIFKDTTLELETAAELGPHNGYIGMISATGILGLIFFLAILIDRIRKCKYIDNYWALILIYIFVINCFESLFILNRFITCFFMFYILASGAEEEE